VACSLPEAISLADLKGRSYVRFPLLSWLVLAFSFLTLRADL